MVDANSPVARNEWLWLAGIACVGLLLRVAAIAVLDIKPESDYAAYQSMAVNLLEGRGIVDMMGNRAMYNVGYPLFVLAPFFAVTGHSLLAAQLANVVLGVIGILLSHLVARELGAGKLGRLAAAALWALYLPSSVYAEYLAKENLMVPLMLAVVWATLRIARSDSLRNVVICGALYGLLALSGNAALALGVATLAALVLSPMLWMRKLYASLALGIVAAVVIAPWAIRNHFVLGAPVLNTNGGFNLYLGNNPAADGLFVSIADTPRASTWGALRKQGEIRASQVLRDDAVAWIKDHPGQFLRLAFKKAALFWTPPIHEGQEPSSTMVKLLRWLWLVQFVILAIASLACCAFPQLRTRQVGIVWLAIAGYTAVHMLFYVIFRYREPIMPFICVLSALCAEQLWTRWRARSNLATPHPLGAR